jgi:hypothetical protein
VARLNRRKRELLARYHGAAPVCTLHAALRRGQALTPLLWSLDCAVLRRRRVMCWDEYE